jgi:trehalose 6-phosphate synthase
LILALDRLPVTLGRNNDGSRGRGGGDDWTVLPMSGGMVNALTPVLRARGGVWVGWCGVPLEELDSDSGEGLRRAGASEPYALRPIDLTAKEVRSWYIGYANQVLWPVFHGLEEQSRTEPSFWPLYQEVNQKFARELAALHRPGDVFWIHDYQLLLVGEELRKLGIDRGISLFLHIPFPPPELFFRLPQAERILSALCDHDLIGFQAERHVANFLACLRRLDPKLRHGPPAPTYQTSHPVEAEIDGRPRRFDLGAFPIGVDYYELSAAAEEKTVERRVAELRRKLGDKRLLLGIDRLDYTKGIRHKLRAFGTLLERHPEWRGKVVLFQAINPCRESVPAYATLKAEIETLVGEINGVHASPGWAPIHYHYRPMDKTELLAHYRAADAAVVTPLEDGMNLVAKEYCATGSDEGVLILSRFAGAAAQLADGALLVNPWDEEALAETLQRALTLDAEERRSRMDRLRAAVRNEDIYHWAGSFLKAAQATVQPPPPPAG